MGCQPSSEAEEARSEAHSVNTDFRVTYRQFVAKDRGDVCEFYHFSKIISRSATSIVRKVIHRSSKVERICKIIPLSRKDCMSAMREVETLRKLDHPNIVQIHEYFLEDSYLYIILEDIPGKTLINQVVSNGGIKLYEIVCVMRQMLAAVEYMHQQNYCHRLINPDNMLLVKTREGYIVKIIDFSQACVSDCPRPTLIPRSKKISTFQPPQGKQEASKELLEKADVWGCALVLYTLVSGRSPKDLYLNRLKLLEQLKQENKTALGITLLQKMVAQDPLARPSASECLKDQFFEVKRPEDVEKRTFMFRNLRKFNAQSNLKSMLWMYASLNLPNFQEKSEYMLEFHNLDKNRDGCLDFEEMVMGIQNAFSVSREKALFHAEQIFTSLDKNKNGHLDYSEFLMGSMAVSKVLTEENLRRMFNEIDTNGNGRISEDQINSLIEDFDGFSSIGQKGKSLSFEEFKEVMRDLAKNQRQSDDM